MCLCVCVWGGGGGQREREGGGGEKQRERGLWGGGGGEGGSGVNESLNTHTCTIAWLTFNRRRSSPFKVVCNICVICLLINEETGFGRASVSAIQLVPSHVVFTQATESHPCLRHCFH